MLQRLVSGIHLKRNGNIRQLRAVREARNVSQILNCIGNFKPRNFYVENRSPMPLSKRWARLPQRMRARAYNRGSAAGYEFALMQVRVRGAYGGATARRLIPALSRPAIASVL